MIKKNEQQKRIIWTVQKIKEEIQKPIKIY
jgi:hypothetical protein